MGDGVIHVVEMGSLCPEHRACFLLYSGDLSSLYLLTPHWVLVMDEKFNSAPDFLLSFWVCSSGTQNPKEFNVISAPFKVCIDGIALEVSSFLLCGDHRHFSSCLGEGCVLLE
jgi:hypothetical protein